jgi:hypothetical protein
LSESTDPTPSKSGAAEVAKQVFLVLLTGGISLLWLIARRLPDAWERTWLLRAEWISKGRNPREWGWLGRGWMAVLGTTLVAIPASLVFGSLGSLAYRGHPIIPGQRIPIPALLLAMIFLGTLMTMGGLFCIYLGHTLRMATVYAWDRIRSQFSWSA